VWIGKQFHNIDVREHGSGNAGTTNTIRVLGWTTGIPVLLIDITKDGLLQCYRSSFIWPPRKCTPDESADFDRYNSYHRPYILCFCDSFHRQYSDRCNLEGLEEVKRMRSVIIIALLLALVGYLIQHFSGLLYREERIPGRCGLG